MPDVKIYTLKITQNTLIFFSDMYLLCYKHLHAQGSPQSFHLCHLSDGLSQWFTSVSALVHLTDGLKAIQCLSNGWEFRLLSDWQICWLMNTFEVTHGMNSGQRTGATCACTTRISHKREQERGKVISFTTFTLQFVSNEFSVPTQN